ncbi:MAG: zinc ABC transporter substrate-binding protein [Clostridia bacterium]|nr:zinc ABC transporter substrate-binding protein [Clostridia bacterium]
MKKFYAVLIVALLVLISGCAPRDKVTAAASSNGDGPVKVAVSIMPQLAIVNAIGGDYVDVVAMIPPGNSPANYAPTQKEMTALTDSVLYFSIGVPTETVNILPLIQSDYDMKIVDMAAAVDAVYPARFFSEDAHEDTHAEVDEAEGGHEHENGRDPHIWLSPKRIKLMAAVVARELSDVDPDHVAVFEENLNQFLSEIDDTEAILIETLGEIKDASVLIYHPSIGYFADDFQLNMVALESEGKEATMQGMTKVVDYALENGIKTIFYQQEFDSKQAELIAAEIGGTAVQINPLSEDLVNNLEELGTLIRNSME